jgi:hypothetical protein
MSVFQFKTAVSRLLILLAMTTATSLHAGIVATYWADATTSPANVYSYEAPMAVQAGNAVVGVIPTNATTPDLDVINYFRTLADLPGASTAYDGVLLGNLSNYTGLTATFNLYDSALAPGALFQASELVGETGSNFGIRLMFMGGYLGDGTPNEWWSNPVVVYATSMGNGQDVTLTAVFDPSQWSNYYGHVGTESPAIETQFTTALAGVTRLGLSFGSGSFFSDGFAFNTGGNAQIQLDAIATYTDTQSGNSVPEPGTCALLGGALCVLGLLRRSSRR